MVIQRLGKSELLIQMDKLQKQNNVAILSLNLYLK